MPEEATDPAIHPSMTDTCGVPLLMEFALSYYSLLDLSLKDIIDTIQEGEKVGIQYAVLGQSAVRDCFVGLTQIASVTKTIKLGTNVVPIYTRTPTDLSMSAITLNEATGGRFRLLGIGAGGRLKIEPNHGVKVEKIAERTKEYIEIIRGILAGQRLSYQGQFFQLDNAWVPQMCSAKIGSYGIVDKVAFIGSLNRVAP